MRLGHFTKFILAVLAAISVSLGAGAGAYGQQVVAAEVLYWHAGSPLRLHVTWADNSYSVAVNGAEVLTNEKGDFGAVDEWVRLDPILKVGENTLTFSGTNAAPGPKDPNPWRFDVYLESQATGRWAALKDYSAKSQGYPVTAPQGLQYKLTVKVTISE